MEDGPAKQKQTKNEKKRKKRKKRKKSAHRREKGALWSPREKRTEKRSNQKRKKPQETWKLKGENYSKEEQVEKGLRTSSHKSTQKWKEPSKRFFLKPKQLKPKFASKTALEKSLPKQNKIKQIARCRNRNRETELELTHLFKNKSFDISLPREFLYTSQRQNWNWRIFSKISRLTFLSLGSFFTHPRDRTGTDASFQK